MREYIIKNASCQGYPWLKQPVYAMIKTSKNEEFFSSNFIKNKIEECPRLDFF